MAAAIGIVELMLLSKLAASKSEARRLIQQGGIFVDDEKIESIAAAVNRQQLENGIIIRKGKKTYHKIVLNIEKKYFPREIFARRLKRGHTSTDNGEAPLVPAFPAASFTLPQVPAVSAAAVLFGKPRPRQAKKPVNKNKKRAYPEKPWIQSCAFRCKDKKLVDINRIKDIPKSPGRKNEGLRCNYAMIVWLQ